MRADDQLDRLDKASRRSLLNNQEQAAKSLEIACGAGASACQREVLRGLLALNRGDNDVARQHPDTYCWFLASHCLERYGDQAPEEFEKLIAAEYQNEKRVRVAKLICRQWCSAIHRSYKDCLMIRLAIHRPSCGDTRCWRYALSARPVKSESWRQRVSQPHQEYGMTCTASSSSPTIAQRRDYWRRRGAAGHPDLTRCSPSPCCGFSPSFCPG